MTDAIVHRGPDSSGYYLDDRIGIGFRRLSIIDIAGGDQPMYSADRSIVMVCNGEIFNHQELRRELSTRGHTFKTRCDVEVLVYLYQEYGLEFVNKINGQFAFMIYDSNRERLFLARDHAGIIPLYYTMVDGLFIFASEIKALLKHELVRPEVNLTGLDQVLSLPGLASPVTMFKDVHSLKSGHCIVVDEDVHIKTYWDLDYPREGDIDRSRLEQYYVSTLKNLLLQSVKRRLQADVPVGFYLSGGLDSSLIAGIIKSIGGDEGKHSFSIGFTDNEISETQYQRLMADHVRSIHHEILFDWDEISARLTSMIYHCECPVKETYNTCSMALAQAARSADVTVILTGEGADELFAGYVGYRFDRSGLRGSAAPANALEALMEEELRGKVWGDKGFFYEQDFHTIGEIKSAIYSPEVNEQYYFFDCFRSNIIDKSRLEGRHILHKRSYVDFKLRLADHLVSDHGDRMAMAHSIEARYPFLDKDLIEFACTIPPDLKLNGMSEKYIIKKIAYDFIPKKIIEREKFGFHAPGSPHLLKQHIEWIDDMLSYERINRQGYFNPDVVEALKAQYLRPDFKLNLPFENDLLMVVLTFGIFLDVFKMPSFR